MSSSQTVKTGIRKGDLVRVISGKEKGKNGKVLQVIPEKQRLIIEKLNMIKRHTRPNQKNRQGGIVEREGSIHLSNVMLLCPQCNKPTRFTKKLLEDGNKIRSCRRCNEAIDKT